MIPTLNEARNVAPVIDGCLRHVDEVLVIDGASTDDTRMIAASRGARVVLQRSQGKGAAIAQAPSFVRDGLLVFIDADQSHDPDDIPRLVAPITQGQADLVVGSRMLGGSDELFTSVPEFCRLVGGHILTLAIARRFRSPLTDSQNGFRAIRVEVLSALQLRSSSFTVEMEMCIRALRLGYRVAEVPTHEYRRRHGSSHINALRLGPKYIWVCLRELAKPTPQ